MSSAQASDISTIAPAYQSTMDSTTGNHAGRPSDIVRSTGDVIRGLQGAESALKDHYQDPSSTNGSKLDIEDGDACSAGDTPPTLNEVHGSPGTIDNPTSRCDTVNDASQVPSSPVTEEREGFYPKERPEADAKAHFTASDSAHKRFFALRASPSTAGIPGRFTHRPDNWALAKRYPDIKTHFRSNTGTVSDAGVPFPDTRDRAVELDDNAGNEIDPDTPTVHYETHDTMPTNHTYGPESMIGDDLPLPDIQTKTEGDQPSEPASIKALKEENQRLRNLSEFWSEKCSKDQRTHQIEVSNLQDTINNLRRDRDRSDVKRQMMSLKYIAAIETAKSVQRDSEYQSLHKDTLVNSIKLLKSQMSEDRKELAQTTFALGEAVEENKTLRREKEDFLRSMQKSAPNEDFPPRGRPPA